MVIKSSAFFQKANLHKLHNITSVSCLISHLSPSSKLIQTPRPNLHMYMYTLFPSSPHLPNQLPIFHPQVISFKACFTSSSPIRSTTKWNRTWREAKNSAERIPAMAFWPKAGTPTEATLVDKVGKLRFSWKVGENGGLKTSQCRGVIYKVTELLGLNDVCNSSLWCAYVIR